MKNQSSQAAERILDVQELQVNYRGRQGHKALRALDISIHSGEVVALAGESGSGKSTAALALMGLLPAQATCSAGRMLLGSTELNSLTQNQWQALRGRRMAMIFQDPSTALDPVFSIGDQVDAVFRRHRGMNRRQARQASLEQLRRCQLGDPQRICNSYPHELSGGMKQRVLIAMATACSPELLIADEASSALDVTSQARVMDLLTRQARELGSGLLLITHDLGVVAQYADRAVILDDGVAVEEATVPRLFNQPSSEQARRLIDAAPRL